MASSDDNSQSDTDTDESLVLSGPRETPKTKRTPPPMVTVTPANTVRPPFDRRSGQSEAVKLPPTKTRGARGQGEPGMVGTGGRGRGRGRGVSGGEERGRGKVKRGRGGAHTEQGGGEGNPAVAGPSDQGHSKVTRGQDRGGRRDKRREEGEEEETTAGPSNTGRDTVVRGRDRRGRMERAGQGGSSDG